MFSNWYLGGTSDDWSMVFRRRVLLTIGRWYLVDVGPNFADIKSLASVCNAGPAYRLLYYDKLKLQIH